MPDADEDPRILYAADRTVLAAERTYAAWVRTGFVALVGGVGAKKTLGGVIPECLILFTASLLVLFAAFCFVAAVWRDLHPGHDSPVRSDVRRIPRPLLAASTAGSSSSPSACCWTCGSDGRVGSSVLGAPRVPGHHAAGCDGGMA